MKFAYSWLSDFVETRESVQRLAHQLTMAGIEVEQLTTGAPFQGVVAARVMSVAPHPKADRLRICQVDVGGDGPRQIVCGAPDVVAGMTSACALPGAILPEKNIIETQVRGVTSDGMLCSAQELGLAGDSEGLLCLPEHTIPGSDLEKVLALDEAILTLKLTPNRSDCLSVFGIAREVAAITASQLRLPSLATAPVESCALREVRLEVPGCARYCGRVIEGLDPAAATPRYMAQRLASAGIRAHSAMVDITNYVMLELGQPLHAFDLDRLHGAISVRAARLGEQLDLLNQTTAELRGGELVICDEHGPIALAGVMGGAASAVGAGTRNVFMESAFFSPTHIAGIARRFNLASDSAYRFERGVDFAATRQALERATALVLEICGGKAGEVTDVVQTLPERPPITLRSSSIERLLGISLSHEQTFTLLKKLGIAVEASDAGLVATPPSYRFDLAIEADLVEEVARLYGYDNIEPKKPLAELSMLPLAEGRRRPEVVADLLCARDYQEVVSYSFVDEQLQRDLTGRAGIPLKNPIASQMSVMRSSLIPGLIQAARFNLDRQQERVRLFEIGRCFDPDNGDAQPWRVGGLCVGTAAPEQWGEPKRTVDFYDIKADIEALFDVPVEFDAADHPATHPGQSARIVRAGEACGWLGTLHPKWQQKYALRGAVVFELDRNVLLIGRTPVYQEMSKFPAVTRDIACVVDEKYNALALIQAIRPDLPDFVRDLRLFDMYRGKGIDSGKKSLAFRLVMQDTQKTLDEEEIERVMAHVAHELKTRFGGILR